MAKYVSMLSTHGLELNICLNESEMLGRVIEADVQFEPI